MVVGLLVFTAIVACIYGMARHAPVRTDEELVQIEAERGRRTAERFRQMEQQRHYTVVTGRVLLPLAIVALVVALLVEVIGG